MKTVKGSMINQVQLISYADRFGKKDIRSLHQFLKNELEDIIGGIHLLPFFYPIDGADAGYDAKDNRVVDHRIGSWEDFKQLSIDFPSTVDLIINHISDQSDEFQDVIKNGKKSEFFELFLTKEKVLGEQPEESDISKIYRPRPNLPYSPMKVGEGETVDFWTTFSPKQIDIDVHSKKGTEYIESILKTFEENEIKMIRLDAVGYAIKKKGSSCFMIPETYDFIEKTVNDAHSHGIQVLVEIHAHYETQIEIAKSADYVYDFALPPLVLHSLIASNFKRLKDWLAISPRNCVTVLDTHDGIGVMDVGPSEGKPGLLEDKEIDDLVKAIHKNSGGESQKATGNAASNLDIYQVNCTYYDALGKDNVSYLMARAIQFFAPGIPQVYYAGLLAIENDMELLSETNVGRDINRPYLSFEEAKAHMKKPVVQQFLDLIRLRNTHSSFNGTFQLEETADDSLKMKWQNGKEYSLLSIDLESRIAEIEYSSGTESSVMKLS